jgi:hypothetical protein
MKAVRLLIFVLACAVVGWTATTPVDRRDYTPAGSDFTVATGDFNGDGILDIVTAGTDNPGTISVLLGKGDGTFAANPIVSLAGVIYPDSAAVGDFNHDGKLDLVFVATFDVEVLFGNGDGTFGLAQTILQTNGTINYLDVRDMNGDGNPDVLVSGVGRVYMLLGTGQGTFQAPIQLAYGGYFVTGDFNGDGNLDIAMGEVLNGTSFVVLLGKGDGTFRDPILVYGNGVPFAAGDLNGDGKLDLVLNFNAATYSVVLGNGDGTFQAPTAVDYTPPTGSEAIIPVLVDLNRDGNPDLIIRTQSLATNEDCCGITVLQGNGDGTFGARWDFEAGPYPSLAVNKLMAVADFDGEGDPDLALGGGILFGQGCVSVLLGDGHGGFHEHLPRYSAGSSAAAAPPASVATGDFNRDGTADVASVFYGGNQVAVLLGNGKGVLGAAHYYDVGSGPGAVAVGDFNLDGKLDLVTANHTGNDVTVILGIGDGAFQSPIHTAVGNAPSALAVADFNRDGKPDVAVTNSGSNDVVILLGKGDGTFSNTYSVAVQNGPNAIAVGDFNRDGNPDLAITNLQSQSVTILLGNGDGTFRNVGTLAVTAAPSSIAVGDFNRDGNPDLAVAIGSATTETNAVLVAEGNGDGTFQPWAHWKVGILPSSIAVADFNLDGNPDLVTANSLTSDISVLFGNGDGTFQSATNLGADYFALALAVADFSNDGKPDVVVANPLDGRLTMMINPIR